MKLHQAIAALQLLPAERSSAISAAQFIERWRRAGHAPMSDRQLQRWLPALEVENLVESVETAGCPRRYHRRTDKTPMWAMTQETALRLLVSSGVLELPLGAVGNGGDGVLEMAKSVVSMSQASRRLHRKIRVVQDGVGRLRAAVQPGVQEAVVQAIIRNNQLRLKYRSRASMFNDGIARWHQGTVLGAVSKDGTTYLLITEGFNSPIRTFALQRVLKAEVLTTKGIERPDFNLDAYIDQTHQLSHGFQAGQNICLQIKVHPEAIWHFTERPFCAEQVVTLNSKKGGWHMVRAQLPKTDLLVPYLLSLAEWIVVEGPADVRDEVLKRFNLALEGYRSNSGIAKIQPATSQILQ